ncbi:hypothetical protein CARUB_v10021359mg [Capsella rubella]|uniref:Uncharacterized protein n=1 Tax=Capsella rubella TaxID=81985 RepID=R0IB67_9BRAS|nr:UPF0540 protein At1g62220 [Capsella rubella]EOA33868.1 hypothetical protein CARUB_v10021359mg [Capsella rubella]
MNATKFTVFLVIGVLCAIVTARQVEEVSKETKLGTSNSKAATKGIGAELSVNATTTSYSDGFSYASASRSPKGPRADAYGTGYTATSGDVAAKGRNANASSTSGSSGQGGAAAVANRKGAAATGNGNAGSGSTAKGRTGSKGKKN